MVAKRNEAVAAGSNYVPVLGWRVNTVEKATFLRCADIDGVYTDNIASIAAVLARQTVRTQ